MFHDPAYWEELWSKTLREHAEKVMARPPNPHLLAEAARLKPGRALDAGCGHGAEAIWLAGHGFRVTAIDFSISALEHARRAAEALGADVASRISWVEADLSRWEPEPEAFDLVTSLYVHVSGSVEGTVRRWASGVARGGALILVGHRPIDPETGRPTPAAGQVQVSVEAVREALAANDWDFLVAEERPRAVAGSGVDAVIHARRR